MLKWLLFSENHVKIYIFLDSFIYRTIHFIIIIIHIIHHPKILPVEQYGRGKDYISLFHIKYIKT